MLRGMSNNPAIEVDSATHLSDETLPIVPNLNDYPYKYAGTAKKALQQINRLCIGPNALIKLDVSGHRVLRVGVHVCTRAFTLADALKAIVLPWTRISTPHLPILTEIASHIDAECVLTARIRDVIPKHQRCV